ncbi:MAG: nickel pincer cofactor biosynthesis protein LarB [Proteobacteria bacterium]|nr:nickel pincer cofactor biosynthesis protein LarB [Cystobacterineae bacterium]MCL2259282.1 nickel pincer cofactor biosynthesis protein LarB [Cystobacterineae bacterium]MCL2314318.1 nickel pincer cofactor biosynthesis protein LarB [Pseudomonadota bacterium]
MNRSALKTLLSHVQQGQLRVEDALEALSSWPYAQLDEARVDIHRCLRQGFAEVVLGEFKTAAQCLEVAQALVKAGQSVLITRLSSEKAGPLLEAFPAASYSERARLFWLQKGPLPEGGPVAVVCAGTSDLPVAEEAALTAEAMGAQVFRLCDVGVAGLHRLLAELPNLRKVHAVVAVAGMEGALPTVLGGLVEVPVVAVPTSIGYGVHQGGMATLHTMLSSCAANVSVVNIDNGFGAGFVAALIARPRPPPT